MTEKTDLETEIEQAFVEPALDDLCPICGEEIYKTGRCLTCYSCGWSVCEN
jgi:predicted RNA-binding Zn-ribbon protein involved in translation (DUF1610 family)